MSCDVCLAPYDGYVTFFYEESRKARKPHKCYECVGTIAPGEKYWRVGGKSEGEMWRASVCDFCQEIQRVFSCGNPVEYGSLWENMQECVIPELTVNNECFRKLSDGSRAKLTAVWWEWRKSTELTHESRPPDAK